MSLGQLIHFEHDLMKAADRIQRKGMLVDLDYTQRLGEQLSSEAEQWRQVAASFGVSNVNATADIAAALVAHGAELTERTAKSGAYKVDDMVLHHIAEQGDVLARIVEAILKAKQLEKRRAAYVDGILETVDHRGRVHASINTLGARTARWSVSDPALQQLPSDEALIRKCFIAPDGYVVLTCDYDQVEFRIAGAMAGEPAIIAASRRGESIHETTALQLFGPNRTDHQYRLAKNTGFGFLFGGGATTLARQAEIPFEDAQGVIRRYREEFPRLAEWKREVTEGVYRQALTDKQYRHFKSLRRKLWDLDQGDPARAEIKITMDDICRGRSGVVVTPAGRRIKVDAQRAYSAINYLVQSTARDVISAAVLRLAQWDQLMETVVMVVHDEVVAEVPMHMADSYRAMFEAVMCTTYGPVPLTAKAEIAGRSWGDKYG